MKRLRYIALLLLPWVALSGCDTSPSGVEVPNKPPRTYLTVNSINRSEDNRLSSQINISWWGVDPDGYIIFYEYAINDTSEGAWSRVYGTDSTFVLPITPGSETDDVLFKIRAVDNDSARDEIGARLVYPIINTPPNVSLNHVQIPPDTLFSIASFGWTVGDEDGLENLTRTEIAVNDTANGWVEIPMETGSDQVFISLEVDNQTEGVKEADIYLGRTYTPTSLTVDGLKVGAQNTFYVRTIDQAGASSPIDSTSWFIKTQRSKVLFFNDVSGINSESSQNFHLDLLHANGIDPDIWIINDGAAGERKERLSSAFPTTIDPTLTRTLAQWDHIYWISNSINRNINFVEEIASQFIENGGNFFINIPIPISSTTNDDPILDFISVDSIGVKAGLVNNFVIPNNTVLETSDPENPELKTNVQIKGVAPLKAVGGATVIYTADFKEDNVVGPDTDYTGPEDIGIINSEGNIVFFGLNLQYLNGNNNISDLVKRFCIDVLGFKQGDE